MLFYAHHKALERLLLIRGASPPPRNLEDQSTLFKPRGADYASRTTASPY